MGDGVDEVELFSERTWDTYRAYFRKPALPATERFGGTLVAGARDG